MVFDLTLLTNNHLLLFGVAFITVYAVIALLLVRTPVPLRKAMPGQDIYFAGTPLLIIVTALAAFILTSGPLQIGLLSAAFFTLLVGILDETEPLSAGTQLTWQIIIAIIAVSWGWTIQYVTNPIAPGVIDLQSFQLGNLIVPGGVLSVIWILLLINAINWLDGSDGLATGNVMVAFFTLAAISLLPATQDSLTLSLALIGAGATLGLLLWNFPPAKVYLGTTGSWFLGLFLGLVAIQGGGKIVTTLLVLAIPVSDLLSVSLQRLFSKRAPWQSDTSRHLHFRLRARGYSSRLIAITGLAISAILGTIAITVQTIYKIGALGAAIVMLGLVTIALINKHAKNGS